VRGRRTDFFISYTAVDETWATWIAHKLQAAGFSTVSQDGDFRRGNDLMHEMDVLAAGADRLIVVWPPDYENSRYAEAERGTAAVTAEWLRHQRVLADAAGIVGAAAVSERRGHRFT
jgi:hypothetical protein